jgi:hypothetical protein
VDAFHGGIEFGLTAACEIDVCAFGCKALAGSEADAAGCACDECDLVVEFACHGVAPFRSVGGVFALVLRAAMGGEYRRPGIFEIELIATQHCKNEKMRANGKVA